MDECSGVQTWEANCVLCGGRNRPGLMRECLVGPTRTMQVPWRQPRSIDLTATEIAID